MQTQTTLSFRRMRRTERVLDIHTVGCDSERAEQTMETLLADSQEFEASPAISRRDIALKAKEAIVSLRSEGHDSAADLLRTFFRADRARDAAWLRDLRMRVQAIGHMAPDSDYALNCLQSILAGVGKPKAI